MQVADAAAQDSVASELNNEVTRLSQNLTELPHLARNSAAASATVRS